MSGLGDLCSKIMRTFFYNSNNDPYHSLFQLSTMEQRSLAPAGPDVKTEFSWVMSTGVLINEFLRNDPVANVISEMLLRGEERRSDPWEKWAGAPYGLTMTHVKNPVQEHGASSMEKDIYFLGADRPQTHTAIHPRSEERSILAFSRKGT
jgi:hypothetical protein